jgi:hypothetical protein
VPNLETLPITRHAMARFRQRLSIAHPNAKNYDAILAKILASAKRRQKDNLGHIQYRTRKHGDSEFYYTADGWRVVVGFNEDTMENTIVTIERINKLQN